MKTYYRYVALTLLTLVVIYFGLLQSQTFLVSRSKETLLGPKAFVQHVNATHTMTRLTNDDKIHLQSSLLDVLLNNTQAPVSPVNISIAAHLQAPVYNDIDDVPELTFINYEPFELNLPNFIDENDKRIFQHDSRNIEMLSSTGSKTGVIKIVRNGFFSMPYECGYYQSKYEHTKKGVPARHHYRVLMPLIVPDGWSFQHFLDGTVPKLIQARRLLAIDEVIILLEYARDEIIWDILKTLGVPRDRVVLYQGGGYSADYLILDCVTPPTHPSLWHAARLSLGASEHLKIPAENANIILLTREYSKNGGRKILNKVEVKKYLSKRYGDRFAVYTGNSKGATVTGALDVFQKARIIIGIHGGGFYNMFFAPKETVLVEFMHVNRRNVLPSGLPHAIMWTMANLLSQQFWRVHYAEKVPPGNGIIDITALAKVLDAIELDH